MSNSRNKNCNSIHHSLNLSIFIPTTNHRLIVTRHAGKCFQDFFGRFYNFVKIYIIQKQNQFTMNIMKKNCLLVYFSKNIIITKLESVFVFTLVCHLLQFEWNFLAIKNLEKKILKILLGGVVIRVDLMEVFKSFEKCSI